MAGARNVEREQGLYQVNVGQALPRRLVLSLQHFTKEPFSSLLVSSLRWQNVENITILINRSPEVQLPAVDSQEQLFDVPDVTQPAFLLSDRPAYSGPNLRLQKRMAS